MDESDPFPLLSKKLADRGSITQAEFAEFELRLRAIMLEMLGPT